MKTRRAFQAAAGVVTVALVGGCQLIAGLGELEVFCSVNDPNCMPCYGDDDCPLSEPCRSWSCVNHRCSPTDKPARTPCPMGMCTGTVPSICGACVDDSDCGNGAYCFANECARCDDGIENGDEWEIDCGGSHCLKCLGSPCSNPNDCLNGFCVDGRCCDAPCDQLCTRCTIPGICMFSPQFQDDGGCDGVKTCNGFGGCALRNGEPCFIDDDCASFKCMNGTCAPP